MVIMMFYTTNNVEWDIYLRIFMGNVQKRGRQRLNEIEKL